MDRSYLDSRSYISNGRRDPAPGSILAFRSHEFQGMDDPYSRKVSGHRHFHSSWKCRSIHHVHPGDKTKGKEAQIAKDADADVIVAQGSDAGGHGFINSASVISLVPEIISTIPGTPVLAAGGISDGSGVLAALALGADAVVMGTRFAVANESAMADKAKDAIVKTRDGGINTKRYYIQ